MATLRLCSIPGCGKKMHGIGFCRAHYIRFRRYGDPLLGGPKRAAKGEPEGYLMECVLSYDGNGCLIWPYCRSGNGYAALQRQGQLLSVSRIVCEQFRGEPPSTDHQAAHSCGRGHEGCVSPNHLSWKTRSGNMEDKIIHGTHQIGAANGNSKLTAADVRNIRSLEGICPTSELASRYSIHRGYVRQIQTRMVWQWLT